MNITDKKYFQQYLDKIGKEIPDLVEKYEFSEKQIDLHYVTQASAVYSSNIEGNSIDLNTYMNYQLAQKKFTSTKEIKEIENLITAYQFAQKNKLNEENFLACYNILSKNLLIRSKRGTYRDDKVGIFGESGLVYLAIEPEFVNERMREFFTNIKLLLSQNHSMEEVFYFASLIHLICVHIHPFMDGNGRAARILEKWFLAEKLDAMFWKIPSEKYYKDNLEQYYSNINLGVNYYELDYNGCIPFLLMLPNSLKSR